MVAVAEATRARRERRDGNGRSGRGRGGGMEERQQHNICQGHRRSSNLISASPALTGNGQASEPLRPCAAPKQATAG